MKLNALQIIESNNWHNKQANDKLRALLTMIIQTSKWENKSNFEYQIGQAESYLATDFHKWKNGDVIIEVDNGIITKADIQ